MRVLPAPFERWAELHWPRLLIIVILLAIAFNSRAGSCESRPSAAWRIGIIASLSGPAGEQGRNWLQGAQFAAKQLGSKGVDVQLLVEDDATIPLKAVSAFHSLAASRGAQAVIGGTWDFLGQAIYPLAVKYKLPVVTPTNPYEILPDDLTASGLVLTNGLSLHAEREAIAAFVDRGRIASAALIYPAVPFGDSHAELFEQIAAGKDIKILYEERFPHDGAYLDAIRLAALKVREHKPDVIYCVVDYAGLNLMMTEFERLNFYPRVLTTQHLDEAIAMSADARRYRNVVGVYPAAIANREFIEEFVATMGNGPKVYAAEGFDAVNFVVHALQAGVEFGSKAGPFEWKGVTGIHRLPAENGQLVQNKAILMTSGPSGFQPF